MSSQANEELVDSIIINVSEVDRSGFGEAMDELTDTVNKKIIEIAAPTESSVENELRTRPSNIQYNTPYQGRYEMNDQFAAPTSPKFRRNNSLMEKIPKSALGTRAVPLYVSCCPEFSHRPFRFEQVLNHIMKRECPVYEQTANYLHRLFYDNLMRQNQKLWEDGFALQKEKSNIQSMLANERKEHESKVKACLAQIEYFKALHGNPQENEEKIKAQIRKEFEDTIQDLIAAQKQSEEESYRKWFDEKVRIINIKFFSFNGLFFIFSGGVNMEI